MKENKEKFFTVGEIADILGINKNTILHYDREGLIQSIRKDNNYRYYCENQINSFKIILCLRKMGFSIDEIKKINKCFLKKDYSFVVDMIKEREKECREDIKELERNIKNLESHKKYIEYLEGISAVNPGCISIDIQNYKFLKEKDEYFCIKDFEEERGVFIEIDCEIKSQEIKSQNEAGYIFEKLSKKFKKYNFSREWLKKYFFGYIISEKDFISGDFKKSKFLIKKYIESYPDKYIFPAGKYAVLYTKNSIFKKEIISEFFKKIEENGYKPSGDLFAEEIFLFDSREAGKFADGFNIKILKININPLTSERLTGLE